MQWGYKVSLLKPCISQLPPRMAEANSHQAKFDPDRYPDGLLEAFNDFLATFIYSYEALAREPPANLQPAQRRLWLGKDKRRVFLGKFAHRNLQKRYEDITTQQERDDMTYERMVARFQQEFTLNANNTLANYNFRKLKQGPNESFAIFTLRVKREAEGCEFSCGHNQCNIREVMIRDQLIFGTTNHAIREKALSEQWQLEGLVRQGKTMEAAAKGAAAISVKQEVDVYRTGRPGPYSKKGRKEREAKEAREQDSLEEEECAYCCLTWCTDRKKCPAREKTCFDCMRTGHYQGSAVCKKKSSKKKKSKKDRRSDGKGRRDKSKYRRKVRKAEIESSTDSNVSSSESSSESTESEEEKEFSKQDVRKILKSALESKESEGIDIGRINAKISKIRKVAGRRFPPVQKKSSKYRLKVTIKEQSVPVYIDTGADVCMMPKSEAKRLKLPLRPTDMRIRPYGSHPKKCVGEFVGTVQFEEQVVNTTFYILDSRVETLISGPVSEALGIISFNESAGVRRAGECTPEAVMDEAKQDLLNKFPKLFKGLGKLKGHKVKLHVDESVKPVKEPPRPVPFHLKGKMEQEIDKLEKQGVIEEHQGPTSFISNLHLTPKDDGTARVVLDMRNANKAIKSTNLPIPRPEHISSKLAGYEIFTKLDFKSAFYQLELEEESRHLTVFHAGDRLMRFKRLIMGCSPSSGELNKALRPLFQGKKHTFVIQDDLIVAGRDRNEHDEALHKVCETIQEAGMTLNPDKCLIAKEEIPWWGMMISKKGIKPDPRKVEALKHMSPPKSKEEVTSFFCMIQSDGYGRDFIPNLANKTKHIRKLLRKDKHFTWTDQCQAEFDRLKQEMTEDIVMHHYNPKLETAIEVDASREGMSAILLQKHTDDAWKIVAVASRTTTPAEARYPQLDLEALAVDYGLRRFRFYLVGGPAIIVFTDHKPLVSIFKNIRKGSSRTDKIKLRHQDLEYRVSWKGGSTNKADYLSRHAIPWEQMPEEEKEETEEFEKLIWFLQFSPYTEAISMERIISETLKDPTLKELTVAIRKGYISRKNEELKPYAKLMDSLTVTEEGLLLKEDQIILPKSLVTLALEKAHRDSHPGITGMKRRIRDHFFIHDLSATVADYVGKCDKCSMFNPKNRASKLVPHNLREYHGWEKLCIDLFGPMPDGRSILVVQDMVTKFPAAQIMTNTNAEHVIAALESIFAMYGVPLVVRTDNGPPFNAEEFRNYLKQNGIQLESNIPYHPNSNLVEALMKPLGKAMKIAFAEGGDKKKALELFLKAYRSSPHSATNISPGDMLFRHGYAGGEFPNTRMREDEEVEEAQRLDQQIREERDEKENRTRTDRMPAVGDWIMTRNRKKTRKFDPTFGPEWQLVTEVSQEGVTSRNSQGTVQRRHADDIKIATRSRAEEMDIQNMTQTDTVNQADTATQADTVRQADTVTPADTVTQADTARQANRDEASAAPRRSTRQARAPARFADYVM